MKNKKHPSGTTEKSTPFAPPLSFSSSEVTIPQDPTKILDDNQVRFLVCETRRILGHELGKLIKNSGINFEAAIRLQSLSARYSRARENRNLTLKEAAQALKVPQYRIKAIEKRHLKEMLPEVLLAYTEFLGQQRWFIQWKKANQKLAIAILGKGDKKLKGHRSRTKIRKKILNFTPKN